MVAKLLIYKILQLFCVMIIGFLIAKLKMIKPKDSVVLSRLSLYLLMPSAILNAFDFDMTESVAGGLLLAFLAAIIIHAVLYLLDILYGKYVSKGPVERASVMYSNAGNLIIPIVSFVLGAEWVVFSTAFLTVQLLFIWTHGVRLFSSSEPISIKKILLNVNIIAIGVGFVLMLCGLRLPNFVRDVISPFSTVLGPVGMLIAGMLAAEMDFKRAFADKRIYRAVAVRTLLYPCIMLVLLRLFAFLPIINGEKILLVSFLACITPSAASVMQFAQIHNADAEYATAINILSTIVCVATMPLFVVLFELF